MKNIKRLSDNKIFSNFVIIPGVHDKLPCSKCAYSMVINIPEWEGEHRLGVDCVLTNEYTEEEQAVIDRMYPKTPDESYTKPELKQTSFINKILNIFKK